MNDRPDQTTFAHALWRNCIDRPEDPALVLGDVVLTYGHLGRRVNDVAAALTELGVSPGSRIAIVSPNTPAMALLMTAAAAVGVTVAPLNWRQADAVTHQLLVSLDPAAVFVHPAYSSAVGDETRARVPVVVLDEGDRWSPFAPSGPAVFDPTQVRPETALAIMPTSGSTGLPKGVTLSQSAMVARSQVLRSELGIDDGDAFIGWAPLFHISSSDYLFATLALGGSFVLHESFNAIRVADELVNRRIGWLFLIPGLILEVLDALGDRDVAGVKRVGAMADLVPVDQLREVERRLGARYLNSFGSTEAGLVPGAGPVRWNSDGEPVLAKRPNPFGQYRVVVDDREAEVGEPGELWLRGATLFSGYWVEGAMNAEVFKDGWFPSGDIVRRDERGDLTYVERRGRMFKCGGENVYPATVERALLGLGGVEEAAVVPVPHPRLGLVPVAFVATFGGEAGVDVATAVTPAVARFEMPREIHVLDVEDFPRNVTGKVERDRLREGHDACSEICWKSNG